MGNSLNVSAPTTDLTRGSQFLVGVRDGLDDGDIDVLVGDVVVADGFGGGPSLILFSSVVGELEETSSPVDGPELGPAEG